MTTNRFLDYKRKQQPNEKEKPTLLLFTGEDGSRLQDLSDVVSTRQVYTLRKGIKK